MAMTDVSVGQAATGDRGRGRVDLRLAALLFLFLLCVYGLTSRGMVWSADAAMRIGEAEYLLDHGAAGYPPDCQPWLDAMGGGMIWGLGQPLTLLPAVLVSRAAAALVAPDDPQRAAYIRKVVRELGATTTNAILGALTCVILYLTGRALGYAPGVCVLAALGLGLGTVWWPYTQDARYEILQGLCGLTAFYCLARHLRAGGTRWAAGAGAAVGLAIITKVSNVVLLPAVALTWGVTLWKRREEIRWAWVGRAVVGFLAPLALFGFIYVWTDWSWCGRWFVNPAEKYPHVQYGLQMSLRDGLALLLWRPELGLVWYAPAAAVGFLWLPTLSRRDAPLVWGILTAFVLNLLVTAKHVHSMGPVWGPRHQVALLAPMGLTFLPWFEAALQPHRSRLRVATGAFFTVAVALQLLATTVQENRFYHDVAALPQPQKQRLVNRFPLAHRIGELADVTRRMVRGDVGIPGQSGSLLPGTEKPGELPHGLCILNYWWALAYYQGVPAPLLALAGLALAAGAVATGSRLRRAAAMLEPWGAETRLTSDGHGR